MSKEFEKPIGKLDRRARKRLEEIKVQALPSLRSKWRRGAEPQDQPPANGEIEGSMESSEKEMTMEKERRDQVGVKAELMGRWRRLAIAREV